MKELTCEMSNRWVWLKYHLNRWRANMPSSEIADVPSSDVQPSHQTPEAEQQASPLLQDHVSVSGEESVWKRYSPHYEFPMSVVIALGLHVIAILVVVAYMTIQIHWGNPKPIVFETYENHEPRIEGEKENDNPGGHTGNLGDNSPDPFAPKFDPLALDNVDGPSVKDPLTDLNAPPENKTSNDFLNNSKRRGLPGRIGIGDLGEEGDKIGRGSKGGSLMARNKRWNIRFEYDEPETLIEQFKSLGVTVAARLNNGRFLVYDQFAPTIKFRELNDEAFSKFINTGNRLWFVSMNRTVCENFEIGVSLSERALKLVMIIPPEMEKAVLQAELAHHRMTEDEIRTKMLGTAFRVVRDGAGYKVSVLKVEVLKP
jgi:hypothetical protein